MAAAKFLSGFSSKVKNLIPRKKKIEDFYEIRSILGSGNYSVVKYGVHKKTGEEVALKIIDKELLSEFERENLSTEIDIRRTYGHHPNIISLKDVYEDRRRLVLVLEYMKGGELLQHLRKKKFYSEKEASVIIKKVIHAIAYLHKCGIVHRDIKPENLLLVSEEDDAEIKIADFGFARYIGEGVLQAPCGSPAYVAPEIVNEMDYGKAVDMWSIGVTLYILLCGFPPFYHEITEKIFAQIQEGKFAFPDPYWTKVSNSAKELIVLLLKVEPKERITAAEALLHPWLQGLTASGEHHLEMAPENDGLKATVDKYNEIGRTQPVEEKDFNFSKRERRRHKSKRIEKSKEQKEEKEVNKKKKKKGSQSEHSDTTSSSNDLEDPWFDDSSVH